VLPFARVDVLGVAWLRIASAALVFAILRRPWRRFALLLFAFVFVSPIGLAEAVMVGVALHRPAV
jgi:threonine/homoserine efflux transporter RhtA